MSKKLLLLTIVLSLVSTAAFAQDSEETHHDVSFSVGAAVPNGPDRAYLNTAPMIALMYGYKFNRFFQAESGFQMAFNAANNQNPETTAFGQYLGGDHEFMIPFSGRVYIPIPLDKWQFSAGGGPTYLHYAETAPNDGSQCFTCTSRGGWGFQGFFTVRRLIGDNFYVGVTTQYVSANISGLPVGNGPEVNTTDHWANALINIGFRF
jgi:Outer membrane protein beta-barrel domain